MNKLTTIEEFFSEFGITILDAENKLFKIRPNDGKYFNKEGRKSGYLMPLYFSAISLLMKDEINILEIGTGNGNITNLLANLFPTAIIHTIDIPVSDKDYEKQAWRRNNIETFKRNIDKSNIKYIEKNSFFLPTIRFPKKFNLIYVDGGHWYPVVAWDTMFTYNNLQPDGFAFFHDYGDGGTHVEVVIEYIRDIIDEEIKLSPSSASPKVSSVAWFRKSAKGERNFNN